MSTAGQTGMSGSVSVSSPDVHVSHPVVKSAKYFTPDLTNEESKTCITRITGLCCTNHAVFYMKSLCVMSRLLKSIAVKIK